MIKNNKKTFWVFIFCLCSMNFYPLYIYATPEDSLIVTPTFYTTYADASVISSTVSVQVNNANNAMNASNVDLHGYLTPPSGAATSIFGPQIVYLGGPDDDLPDFASYGSSDGVHVIFVPDLRGYNNGNYEGIAGYCATYNNGSTLIFIDANYCNPYTLLHELGHMAGLIHTTITGNFMKPPASAGGILSSNPDQVTPLNNLFANRG